MGARPNDHYKSSTKVIHSLIEIVAKGGSLLLGVGPAPDGTLNSLQVQRLTEIGAWLEVNGNAIYGTRTANQERDGETFFTRGKDGSRYALVRLPENQPVPDKLQWKGNVPVKGAKVTLLGYASPVKWEQKDGVVTVTIPAAFKSGHVLYPALAFQY